MVWLIGIRRAFFQARGLSVLLGFSRDLEDNDIYPIEPIFLSFLFHYPNAYKYPILATWWCRFLVTSLSYWKVSAEP